MPEPEEAADGDAGAQNRSGITQSPHQRIAHIERPIAHREHFAGLFDFGGDAQALDLSDDIFWAEIVQGRLEKTPLIAKGVHDALDIAVMRNVAARTARHQNLDTRFDILLEHQNLQPSSGGSSRGPQSGRASAYNDHIPHTASHITAIPIDPNSFLP